MSGLWYSGITHIMVGIGALICPAVAAMRQGVRTEDDFIRWFAKQTFVMYVAIRFILLAGLGSILYGGLLAALSLGHP